MNILTFGAVTDITGSKHPRMAGIDIKENLVQMLEEKYPSLKTTQYAITVDKELIQQHRTLENETTVATLCPSVEGDSLK